jgi:RHS repeat-associated protein
VDYYFADHLGTARAITNAGGTILDNSDFYPFGVERPITLSSGNTYKFTGKERDSETSNDYFGARYYSNGLGRWLSPDWSEEPEPVPYANLANPQTLNLYSMVRDNPESFADLDGHDPDGAKRSGKCGFWCLFKYAFTSKSKNTISTSEVGPVLGAVMNGALGPVNFEMRLMYVVTGGRTGTPSVIPSFEPTTPEEEKVMRDIDMAMLFLPGLEEGELANDALEVHHLLPEQFKPIFESKEVGLDIEKFTIKIGKAKHRLRAGKGLHTNLNTGGNWNRQWKIFLRDPGNRTKVRILEQLDQMILRSFGPA